MAKKIKEFAKVHNSGLKEIFDKDRKYDSILDEHKRIYQEGVKIKVKVEKSESGFERLSLRLLKNANFIATKEDLFDGNILNILDKNKRIKNRIKIIEYKNRMPMKFNFQMMVDKGEVRSSIELDKPFFSKKYNTLTFIQLFKRDKTFFGVNDAIRKRLLRNQVYYRGAILADYLKKIGFLYKDEIPDWAKNSLSKKKII